MLQHKAPVMVRLGGFDAVGPAPRFLPQLLEHLFALPRVNTLLSLAAPDRNQKKHRPEHDAEAFHQLSHHRHLMHVMPGNRGVDLHRHADFFQISKTLQRGFKRAGDAAKRVMCRSAGSVKADRNAADSRFYDLARDFRTDPGAVSGQSHAQPAVRRVTRELEDVFSKERFATAQDENGVGIAGDLLDDSQGLGSGQVKR